MNHREAALLMRKRFGQGAKARAMRRAEELLAQGDVEGHEIWMDIYDALDQLQQVWGVPSGPAKAEARLHSRSVAGPDS